MNTVVAEGEAYEIAADHISGQQSSKGVIVMCMFT